MAVAASPSLEHAAGATAPPGLTVGKLGVWWFLASEIMVFGGLILTFVLARIAAGGWEDAAGHVNARIAATNTLILVTSSLTIVQAHAAARAGARRRAARYLLATVLLGLGFLGVKSLEYATEIRHGFTPASGLFWSYYYTLTGLHALHVIGGIVANAMLFAVAAWGRQWERVSHRVELAGLYWHFVDIVWIFLFPLVYLS
jgi:heme/copper-type cytochrome/quinol oxidase subunit 3